MARFLNKSAKWFFIALGICFTLLLTSFDIAYAETKITTSTPSSYDASKTIQAELDKAKKNATSSNPYIITVPKGSYKLSTALHIYGNTTLVLTGVELTRSVADINVLKIGENDDNKTGYYYQNIAVNGGTFNGNNTTGTVVKFGHGKKIVMRGSTIKNVKDGHLMEVAGIDGLVIDGCRFDNQKLSASNSMPQPEALQLDILSQRHMKGYRSEDLPLKNITVSKCTFSNVPRGVGSHTAVINNPVNGVSIVDNTFINTSSAAIQGLNYINCVISGNKISGTPRGIIVYAMFEKGIHFGSSLGSEGNIKSSTSSAYKIPLSNQNIVVSNNTVSVSGKDSYFNYEGDGIYLAGLILSSNLKATADRDAIKKGNYYMSGATVSNNVINTKSHGIRFRDVRKSVISNNTITYSGAKSTKVSYYGIQLTQLSKVNMVQGNIIKKAASNGVYINEKSSAKLISKNKISSPGKYGISVEKSSATKIANNAITKSSNNAIHLFKNAKVSFILKNTIDSPKGIAINVDQNCIAGKIDSNVIKNPKLNGVLVHNNATAKKIMSNKISKCGDKALGIYSTKANVSITGNKIVKTKNYGIYIDVKTKKSKIVVKANKLSGAGKSSRVKVVSGKVLIYGSKKA